MKQPTVQCPHCQGRGAVELKPHLARTLAALPDAGATTIELQAILAGRKDEQSKNALINRLETLRRAGLVVRPEKRGKFFLYRRTPLA